MKLRTAVIVAVFGLAALGLEISKPAPALAVANFDQGKAVDLALTYVGGYGGKACQDANAVAFPYDPGECKEFVRCIMKMASGDQVQLGGGYYSDYAKYGVAVSPAEATKGDVIQLNDPASPDGYKDGMHTALIVAPLGNNTFDVVDSNYVAKYTAGRHNWNPFDTANAKGLVVNIWRLGNTAPDPASRNPIGNFESLTSPGPGLIQMVGWGLDYDNGTGPADVLEEIDGTPNPRKADKPRADVGNAYPGYGNDHGFNDTLYASGGNHTVRVTVLNVGTGTANTVLGPRTVFVPYSVGEGAHNLPSGYSGPQAFLDAYTSYGGAGIIGLAENPVHMDPRNIAQIQDTRGGSYRRGLLVQRGAYPVLIVSGDARDYLESHFGGSVFDQMGYPRNNNHPWANGNLQDFDGGSLGDVLLMKGNYVGQVFKVFGAIRQGYINNGGADSLGYPMSDEYACGDKVCQKFERKTIEWSGWTGIRVF